MATPVGGTHPHRASGSSCDETTSNASEVMVTCAEGLSDVTIGEGMLVLKGEDTKDTREVSVTGERLQIALIADGHGGKEAATHCKATVLDALVGAIKGPPAGLALRQAGESAFLRAHKEVHGMLETTSGATLTVVIVNAQRAEVTVLHSGDSVARLVPRRSLAIALCEDHRIDSSEEERARLTKLGGKMARAMDRYGRPSGPLRLWPGGVAQARAIGDRDVGDFIEPRPHARTFKLPASESCSIVICSDGVWDALLPEAVDTLVRSTMANGPDVAANLVVRSSLTQRHAYSNDGDEIPKDDTTCVVLKIEDPDDRIVPTRPFGCC